jgi:hypothetical protein
MLLPINAPHPQPRIVVERRAIATEGRIAPDGRWLAVAAAIGGYRSEVPHERQEARYFQLAQAIERELASLRHEYSVEPPNPNQASVAVFRGAPDELIGLACAHARRRARRAFDG